MVLHSVLKCRTNSDELLRIREKPRPLKKSLLYLMAAIVLGVAMTLTPVIAVAFVRQGTNENVPKILSGFGSLERGSYELTSPGSYSTDFTVVVFSFAVAIILYLYVRHRVPRGFTHVRFPPC
jgi:multidrug efflux pump subunit AcrB